MSIEPTSERLYLENYQSSRGAYLIYLIHLATYKFSMKYVTGKKVLDYGCGSGYGTALISKSCSEITGVDIAPDAIAYAKDHFTGPNLSYLTVNRSEEAPLPFPDASFDVVLSFQVIEHILDIPSYLREIERVLIPGGQVIFATPDRSSRLFPFQKPWNMWHVKEYSSEDLYKTLTEYFINVKILKIGGLQDILKIELNRTRKLMWVMLPLTLPFIPEAVRIGCIRFIKFLEGKFSRHSTNPIAVNFDETALRISEHEEPSIDLIAVAEKNL